MPNFKKLAKAYEKDSVKVLQGLVSKKSVYDPKTISESAPYGVGVKSALDEVARLGKEYGFSVDSCDGHATELSIGNGPTLVGIYAHADVVPVSGTWSSPCFGGKIVGEGKDAKMIGRGTSDDKGPLVASLLAMKLLKDNGLLDGYTVRLVAGGDEERGSSCLEYYFKTLRKKDCDYGFTPDADFPLIYAEKGIRHGKLSRKIDLSPIVSIDGGVVVNAVCDRVLVTLASDKKLIASLNGRKDVEVTEYPGVMILAFKGKSAHASTPELGENAMVKAFETLGAFYKNEFLSNLAKTLGSTNGSAFGGYHHAEELGDTTYNYGIVHYANGTLEISVDFRHGENVDSSSCMKALEESSKMGFSGGPGAPVLLFDKKSPLVSTLMKSYKRMTLKLFDKPIAIGGGTYAKEAKNCVAYGSAFAGHPGNIHGVDEYIYLDDLYKQIAIYADAIYSLGKLKK